MLFLLPLEYFGKLFFGGRFVLYEISLRLKSGEHFVLRIINLTDAISFKIKIYSGTATFTSYILPESEWASPTTPEYAWKQESVQYDPELDETYLVEGYRYTGFDEDEY